jgi:hypothetical protein
MILSSLLVCKKSIVSSSWWWAYKWPKHVEQITRSINYWVASSWFSSSRIISYIICPIQTNLSTQDNTQTLTETIGSVQAPIPNSFWPYTLHLSSDLGETFTRNPHKILWVIRELRQKKQRGKHLSFEHQYNYIYRLVVLTLHEA